MKAPRTAHWLLVPTLTLGMALGPVWAQAAPAKPGGDAEAAPNGKGGGAEGEPEPGGAPKGGSAAKGKGGEAPKGGAAPKTEPGEAPKGGTAPKTEPGGAPKGGTAPKSGAAKLDVGAPIDFEPEDSGASPDADAGASPDAGVTDAPDAAVTSPDAEPTEPPVVEVPLEPEITVQPRPVEAGLETRTAAGGTASREAVTDPRRLRSDDRILFRAGILSLGVAAAAVVPTVIGFQQAYVAHEDDDPARERTMRGLGIGAGVAAGTYAITGVVLLALGARQRRAALAPAVGPGRVGLVLRARF
jgi:hypothetical protein